MAKSIIRLHQGYEHQAEAVHCKPDRSEFWVGSMGVPPGKWLNHHKIDEAFGGRRGAIP